MRLTLSTLTLFLAMTMGASAYVGPGVGAGVIATVLGVFAAIGMALFAVFWYPIKRAIKRRRGDAADDDDAPAQVNATEKAE